MSICLTLNYGYNCKFLQVSLSILWYYTNLVCELPIADGFKADLNAFTPTDGSYIPVNTFIAHLVIGTANTSFCKKQCRDIFEAFQQHIKIHQFLIICKFQKWTSKRQIDNFSVVVLLYFDTSHMSSETSFCHDLASQFIPFIL